MFSTIVSVSLLRQTLRRLAREPGFTATALVTLALCLGANLTIFAVVDSVLLRPLPFPEADRLVTLFNTRRQTHYPQPLTLGTRPTSC